jgi:hypothetical protein
MVTTQPEISRAVLYLLDITSRGQHLWIAIIYVALGHTQREVLPLVRGVHRRRRTLSLVQLVVVLPEPITVAEAAFQHQLVTAIITLHDLFYSSVAYVYNV